MGHNSVSGGGQSSGSHLDFASYWADKTVEDAIHEGVQLRLQKTHPIPPRDLDVVKIDIIKPPCSNKYSGQRRKKLAKLSAQRKRSRSPARGVSRSKSPKKYKKRRKPKPPPCGMRVAELAVPTKRHCLETWKSKYDTLPDFMIERLRQQVMDQRPVVPISDAIDCFKRKCKRRKQTEKPIAESKAQKIKNRLKKHDVHVLSAIFGQRIAKKLIVPLNIVLNSDLEKIASVISYDIENVMRKSKNIDTRNKIYKMIEKDIVNKVTIWIAGILEETNEKILEDQLREFEEEVGPALDCVDDLVDNVLDICLPVQEILHDTFSSESDDSGSGLGESLETHVSSEKHDLSEDYVSENIEDHFRTELVTIINNINSEADQNSNEFVDVAEGFDLSEAVEVNEEEHLDIEDLDSNEGIEENEAKYLDGNEDPISSGSIRDNEAAEQEGLDSSDVVEFNDDENPDVDAGLDSNEVMEENKAEYLEVDEGPNSGETVESNEQYSNENVDANRKEDEYLESEDITQKTEIADIPLDDSNNLTDTFVDATENNESDENPPLPEELDRKVTFGGPVTDKKEADVDVNWKASLEHIAFAEPNEGLLSEADETWPEDFQMPILRPSQSVSKSITSLGRIKEDEEKTSVKPEEGHKDEHLEAHKTDEILETTVKPDEENENEPTEGPKADETLVVNAEYVEKPIDRGELDEKKITAPKRSKDETSSKGSGKKDRGSMSKRISDSKKRKHSPKKSIPSGSQRSPSRSSKTSTPSTRPVTKKPNEIKDKTKTKGIELKTQTKSSKNLPAEIKMQIDDKFSSDVKPKPDYRVNIKTAPAWINRNFKEPSCSCIKYPSTSKAKSKINNNLVRKWCKDLEQSYDNLKLWNDWVNNTSKTVLMLQKQIGKSCPEGCSVIEWMRLKNNIDRDVALWIKLNQQTKDRLKCYKNMYQNRSDKTPSVIFCSKEKMKKPNKLQ